MTNHRINIIAVLSAIAFCAAPSLRAQTNSSQEKQSQSSSTSSATSSTVPSGSSKDTTRSKNDSNQLANQSASKATPPSSAASQTDSSSAAPETSISSTSTSPSTSASASAQAGPATQTPAASTAEYKIKRADAADEQASFAKFKGQRVQDSNGNELGKINDFIIDAATGRIDQVVISTGGLLGVGDKLRLMPATNVKSQGDDFSTDMQKAEFEALPTISEKELKAGQFTAHTSTAQSTAPSEPAAIATSSGQLVRASQLKDKSIRADDFDVGEIEHVVIDLPSGMAMVVIDVNRGFAGEDGRFLIPFSKLEVRPDDARHIVSSLLKSDFARQQETGTTATGTSPAIVPASATPITEGERGRTESVQNTATAGISSQDTASRTDATGSGTTIGGQATPTSSSIATSSRKAPETSPGVATATPPSSTGSTIASGANAPAGASKSSAPQSTSDEQLTPTGRTSADQNPASAATAMSIRQALDNDSTLAREDVQVTTKIVLRGTVKSEDAKNRIEELAKKAANEAEIVNQITVQQK